MINGQIHVRIDKVLEVSQQSQEQSRASGLNTIVNNPDAQVRLRDATTTRDLAAGSVDITPTENSGNDTQ
jgi:hypothetical protein